MANGRLTNNIGEVLACYGPKIPGTNFDNSLYLLPDGATTPHGWDCDGFYVPNDRIASQALSDLPGPLAIKYIDLASVTITRDGTKYNCPLNQGAFKPSEVCCPSNYPTCVCWNIPDILQSAVSQFPPVPSSFNENPRAEKNRRR